MSSLTDHFKRVTAQKLATAAVAEPDLSKRGQTRPLGETLVAQSEPVHSAASNIELKFFNDFEQISALQSRVARNAKKSELLPEYLPYIDGVLAAGVSEQNDMLVKLMIWALDTQDLPTAMRIAEFALLNKMAMPAPFSRDVATVFAEQLADEVLKNDATADSELLQQALDLTAAHDMPDQARAKLYRALGDTLKSDKVDEAIKAYETALKLDDGVGCKTDLKELKKLQEQ